MLKIYYVVVRTNNREQSDLRIRQDWIQLGHSSNLKIPELDWTRRMLILSTWYTAMANSWYSEDLVLGNQWATLIFIPMAEECKLVARIFSSELCPTSFGVWNFFFSFFYVNTYIEISREKSWYFENRWSIERRRHPPPPRVRRASVDRRRLESTTVRRLSFLFASLLFRIESISLPPTRRKNSLDIILLGRKWVVVWLYGSRRQTIRRYLSVV